jgi:hypothetical protein
MRDEVKLKPEHVVILAGAVGGGMHQKLVNLLAAETRFAAGKKMVVVTVSRADAKRMQRALLYQAQIGEILESLYTEINDAFRSAYDETLRRKCGEA